VTQTGRGRAVIVPGLVDAASFAAAIAHSGLKRSKTKRSFGRNRIGGCVECIPGNRTPLEASEP